MAEIFKLDTIDRFDLPVEDVISAATDKLKDVVVIGYTKEGGFYFASSKSNSATAEVLMLLKKAERVLMDMEWERL